MRRPAEPRSDDPYDLAVVPRSSTVAGYVTLVAAFGLMTVHYFGGTDGDPEGWFSSVGFGAPFVGVGLMAVVGGQFVRPTLSVAAGAALGPMSVVSVAMWPLLIAAVFLFLPVGTVRRGDPILVPMACAAALVAVFGYLVFHQDPVTWVTPTGGGGSSNIVTVAEASISLVVTGLVVVGAVVWARRPPASPGPVAGPSGAW